MARYRVDLIPFTEDGRPEENPDSVWVYESREEAVAAANDLKLNQRLGVIVYDESGSWHLPEPTPGEVVVQPEDAS